MLGNRGQQMGEYAVLIGIVASAFIATQMIMTRSVGGGLVGLSAQVLGPPEAVQGTHTQDITTTTQESGDQFRTRTQLASSAQGNSAAGSVLTDAYGPYIGSGITIGSSDGSLAYPVTLTGFFDASELAQWGRLGSAGVALDEKDIAEHDPRLRVEDHDQDGVNDILASDDTTGDSGHHLHIPTDVRLNGKDVVGHTMVGWFDSTGLPKTGNGITSRPSPQTDEERKEQRKRTAFSEFVELSLRVAPASKKFDRDTDRPRRLKDILEDVFGAFMSEDPKGKDHLNSEMNAAKLLGIDTGALSPDEAQEMLKEAMDPTSQVFQGLKDSGVFRRGVLGETKSKYDSHVEVALRDSKGKVVLHRSAGGGPEDWKTGDDPEYNGKVLYSTGKVNGQKVPYEILVSEPTPEGKTRVIRLGTFASDPEKDGVSLDAMEVADMNAVGVNGDSLFGATTRDEPLTESVTQLGTFNDQGEWDVNLNHTDTGPIVIPVYSNDGKRRAWFYRDEKTARKLLPEYAQYVFIPDSNGNGRLDQEDRDKAARNKIFVLSKSSSPPKGEMIQTDIPTNLEILGDSPETLKDMVVFKRANPNTVAPEDRKTQPSGLTKEALVGMLKKDIETKVLSPFGAAPSPFTQYSQVKYPLGSNLVGLGQRIPFRPDGTSPVRLPDFPRERTLPEPPK